MWIYIIIAIIILIIIYVFSLYNSFVKLNNMVKEAFSTMDVYLKKRWDLIPNIVEIVKGYAKHEKETLEVMILQDSTYFYNIFPYTYVLGVSDKQIKKFEDISLQAPY